MQFGFQENLKTLLEDPGDSITPQKQFNRAAQEEKAQTQEEGKGKLEPKQGARNRHRLKRSS